MVSIRPFKGYRYSKEKVEVEEAILAPYEIQKLEKEIDKEAKYSILRVILGDYELLDKLVKDGVIEKEDDNCIYVYSQEFEICGKKMERTGFVSIVEIDKTGKKICAHELTIPDNMIDREALIEKTRANVGLIFSLYSDKEKTIDSILKKVKKTKPVMEEITSNKYENITHRLWLIDNSETIGKITKEMENKTLIIADGHHRYTTSIKYMEKNKDDERAKYVSMMMVNAENEGLLILPTHRLLKGIDNFNREEFMKKLSDNFTIESIKFSESEIKEKLSELKEKMNDNGQHTFGLYAGGEQFHIIRLKKDDELFKKFDAESKVWVEFDMDILRSVVFKEALGIDTKDQDKITYVKDIREGTYDCINKIRRGEYQILFLLNPVDIEAIEKAKEMKNPLPPKTTCFYPKVYSGVVMYKFDGNGRNF